VGPRTTETDGINLCWSRIPDMRGFEMSDR
jgi:hypothetical protein